MMNGMYEQLSETSKEMNPNIFTAIHLNENQHTALLWHILTQSHKTDGKALNAFFEMIKDVCPQFNYVPGEKTEISSQSNYVDLRIMDTSEDNKFCLIIENKCCNAVDQNLQIENYVQSHTCLFYEKNIFVVYLTLDGSKQVSDESLTPAAKDLLDYTETSSGRFITMNYADHILPWLKKQNEVSFNESVSSYIGYLENLFDVSDKSFAARFYALFLAGGVITGTNHFSDAKEIKSYLPSDSDKSTKTMANPQLKKEFEKIYALIRKKNLKKIQQIAREHFSDDLEIDESTIDSEWWRIRSKKMDQWFTGFDSSKGPAYGIYFNPDYLDATYPKLTIRLSFLLDTPGVKEFLEKKGIIGTNGKRYTPWQPNWQKVDDINLEDVVQKLIAEAEEKLTEFCEEYK